MSFVSPDWLVPKSMQADLCAAIGIGMSALGISPGQLSNSAPPEFASPIAVETVQSGTGIPAQPGDRVTLHFIVRTLEGKELANSQKRGMPFTVELDSMGSFWSTALEGARLGGHSRLRANTSVFFGKNGVPPVIPADTMIEADLIVLKIQKSLLVKK